MEFAAKGRLTLDGVTFYIKADSLLRAKRRATNGDFDSYETDTAETVDAVIRAASVEENE